MGIKRSGPFGAPRQARCPQDLQGLAGVGGQRSGPLPQSLPWFAQTCSQSACPPSTMHAGRPLVVGKPQPCWPGELPVSRIGKGARVLGDNEVCSRLQHGHLTTILLFWEHSGFPPKQGLFASMGPPSLIQELVSTIPTLPSRLGSERPSVQPPP